LFNFFNNLIFNMTHTLLPCTLFIANFLALITVIYFAIWGVGFVLGGLAALINHFTRKN